MDRFEAGGDRLHGERLDTYTTSQGLLVNNVTALCEDSATNLWIGTSRGLNYLHAGQMEAFPLIDGVTSTVTR